MATLWQACGQLVGKKIAGKVSRPGDIREKDKKGGGEYTRGDI